MKKINYSELSIKDVISEQGENSLKIVKRTGCNKKTEWMKFSQVVKQTGGIKRTLFKT